MNFDLSDEQKMLAEQARALLADRAPFDRLRALIDEGADWDEPLWRELAAMGFLGATIDEAYGGLGMTALDMGVIQQELGRANAAVPLFSSIVLAARAIQLAGSEAQQRAWLPQLASGACVACFADADGRGGGVTLADNHLSGIKTAVADAGVARLAVVRAGEALVLVRLDGPGVTRARLDSFDQLRPHYRLTFDGAPAEPLPGADRALIETLFDQAAVQAAFEATGAAEACLVMARDYALERHIFGRPLAGYQAIKHKLADLAVAVEMARSSAYYAAWTAGEAPGALPAAAAAARLTAAAAFQMGARENLQVHGGIGYTFEANCHFYYRRERALAVALGGRDHWAARLIAHRHAA